MSDVAVLVIPIEQIEGLLSLPPGAKPSALSVGRDGRTVRVLLLGPNMPHVAEGCEAPSWRTVVQSDGRLGFPADSGIGHEEDQ
jgi:hypothetical protein